MTLSRITSTLAAVALGGVVVGSTYGAPAVGSSRSPDGTGRTRVAVADHFRPPVTHRYGRNGMRLGLHCETSDMS